MNDPQAAEGEQTLDTRGLNCPLPVLKARKRLMAMQPGQRLVVLATDPKAPDDFVHFCAEAGHRHLGQSEAEGAYRIVIARG
jgi:tRNA 2-thiouridine synthesizing protein A